MPRYTISKQQEKAEIILTAAQVVNLINDLDGLGGYRFESRRSAAMQSRLRRQMEKAGVNLSASHGHPVARVQEDEPDRALELNLRDILVESTTIVSQLDHRRGSPIDRTLLVKVIAEEITRVAGNCARLESAGNGRAGNLLALVGLMASASRLDAEHLTANWQTARSHIEHDPWEIFGRLLRAPVTKEYVQLTPADVVDELARRGVSGREETR